MQDSKDRIDTIMACILLGLTVTAALVIPAQALLQFLGVM